MLVQHPCLPQEIPQKAIFTANCVHDFEILWSHDQKTHQADFRVSVRVSCVVETGNSDWNPKLDLVCFEHQGPWSLELNPCVRHCRSSGHQSTQQKIMRAQKTQ